VKVFATSVDVSDNNGQTKQTKVPVTVVFSDTEVDSGECLILNKWSRLCTVTDEKEIDAMFSAEGLERPVSPNVLPDLVLLDGLPEGGVPPSTKIGQDVLVKHKLIVDEMDEFEEQINNGVRIVEEDDVPEVFVFQFQSV
jgi:hypothetical protein